MKSFLDILNEEKSGEKHHVMTFGRMNPPTTGHLKLIHKVHDIAQKHDATHSVVTSHSQDSKKNPLSASQKVKHLKRYSPETHFVSASKDKPTILHHAASLHKKGVTHLHVVVGSDRQKEMHHLLHKYNGVEAGHGKYHFKKITVHSAGHRDPDAEGTEGMSGTKMREHAKNKDLSSFRKGVPSHVPEHHAKELMHDVRKGMGLHEELDRGMFRAIFVTGGPGSGKDIVIREAIAESKIVELNFIQAIDYLGDKQKLSESSSDFRREAIRNRGPLIINGPADDIQKIDRIKEDLEELGYETMMIFVNTTNEVSQERNSMLTRMMVESIRQDKWVKSQSNSKYFGESFGKFIVFDNTGNLDTKEEDIHEIYQETNLFLDSKTINETVSDWFERKNKLNINQQFSSLFKEDNNVKISNKFIQVKKTGRPAAKGPADVTADNRPSTGASDDIRWNNAKRRSDYIFRAYSEAKEATLTKNPEPKESNFSKDKEKDKINKKKWVNGASGAVRSSGIGPEYDTRQQGTVYPMSGLGDVTYREQKEFSNFRKSIKEAIDDPGAVDMGVGGTLNGATNKEPLVTPADKFQTSGITIKRKKKDVKI